MSVGIFLFLRFYLTSICRERQAHKHRYKFKRGKKTHTKHVLVLYTRSSQNFWPFKSRININVSFVIEFANFSFHFPIRAKCMLYEHINASANEREAVYVFECLKVWEFDSTFAARKCILSNVRTVDIHDRKIESMPCHGMHATDTLRYSRANRWKKRWLKQSRKTMIPNIFWRLSKFIHQNWKRNLLPSKWIEERRKLFSRLLLNLWAFSLSEAQSSAFPKIEWFLWNFSVTVMMTASFANV